MDLKFRGEDISLEMIKGAWMWDDDEFGAIRRTVLTEDHFFKNVYSRMRVHLAVQVLSSYVVNLIDRYTLEKGADVQRRYEPLKTIVKACDRLVDIWNANYAKKMRVYQLTLPSSPERVAYYSIVVRRMEQ